MITRALIDCIQNEIDGTKEDAMEFINEVITIAQFDSCEEADKYMVKKMLQTHKEVLEKFEALFEESEEEVDV